MTLPEGFYDLGAFPVPVAIIAGTTEDPTHEIEYFGEVVLEDGDVFSAFVSYDGTEPPAPPTAEEVSATGTTEQFEPEPVVVDGLEICQLSTHAVTDEATGRYYDLTGENVDLESYVGRRVTLTGTPLGSPAIGGAGAERCPDLDVTRIEPAAPVDPGDPAPVDPVDPVVGGDGSADGPGGARVLPSTGGATLVILGAGALLTVAGLLARRATR